MSFRGPNPGFNVFDDMVVGVAIEPGYKRSQFGAPTPVIAALTLVEEIVIATLFKALGGVWLREP